MYEGDLQAQYDAAASIPAVWSNPFRRRTAFGPICPQNPSATIPDPEALLSENCLFLNTGARNAISISRTLGGDGAWLDRLNRCSINGRRQRGGPVQHFLEARS